ncbi:hypothetical protein [Streptosporangium sp. NPDC000396]|uniref:hypothetical protein n=1 Tax=Streptosporangium sp. NPDC000396 TaxID=3366185 RepID=UPI0036750206
MNVPPQRADEVTPAFEEPRYGDVPPDRPGHLGATPHERHNHLGAATDGPHDNLGAATDGPHDNLGAAEDSPYDNLSVAPGERHNDLSTTADGLHSGLDGAPGDNRSGPARATAAPADGGFLFDQDPGEVRRRWQEVQVGFVDDPRDSVERADALVEEVTSSLRNALEARTTELQSRWKNIGHDDTEQLRTALRDYRAMLEQLLDLSTGTR